MTNMENMKNTIKNMATSKISIINFPETWTGSGWLAGRPAMSSNFTIYQLFTLQHWMAFPRPSLPLNENIPSQSRTHIIMKFVYLYSVSTGSPPRWFRTCPFVQKITALQSPSSAHPSDPCSMRWCSTCCHYSFVTISHLLWHGGHNIDGQYMCD